MNVRVVACQRVAAVLALPTWPRFGPRAEQPLAQPERQSLFPDPLRALEQQRRRERVAPDRVVEPASYGVVAVQWKERHAGKVRRSDPERRVARHGSRARNVTGSSTFNTGGAMELGLKGHKVAILATDGVEQVELVEPRKALDAAGAVTHLISPKAGTIQAVNHDEKGDELPVDRTLAEVHASEYDALLLPGGVKNPDTLRMDQKAVQFVREFMLAEKPVAAICHGPWLLAEAEVIDGRAVTSWPSIRTDLRHAGATVVDQEVCVDGNLITSRKPDDIPAFNRELLAKIGVRVSETA
jgi:protease I